MATPEENQMEMMLEGGGLNEQGGTVDPISGNEVPDGATQEGVRDDVPAMLSEGEYVMNEASTRYHGVDKLNAMQNEAKQGYNQMEKDGLMGQPTQGEMLDTNSEIPFGMGDINIEDNQGQEIMMADGGLVPKGFSHGGMHDEKGRPIQATSGMRTLNTQNQPNRPQPSFGDSMGGFGGFTFKNYQHPDGRNMMVPFMNGVPMFSIPEGFVPFDVNDPNAVPPTPVVDPVVTPAEVVKPVEYGGGPDDAGGDIVSMEDMSSNQFNNLTVTATKAKNYKGPFKGIVNNWGENIITKQNEIVSKDLDAVQKSFTVSDGTYGNFGPGVNEFGEVGSGGVDGTPNADGTVGTSLGEFGGLGAEVTGPGTKNPNVLSETSYAKTPTVTTNASKAIADKIAKDKKDKADKAIIALAEKAIADKVAKDKEFNAMESATYSDNSPATGGFTGYSGDYGGPDNDPSGTGGTGGYGMFNKGGLAGKKPKKKMKTYKKGGLVTPKK